MSQRNPTLLSPMALTMLGLDPLPTPAAHYPTSDGEGQARPERRVASYFNVLQTRCAPSDDAPPSYAVAQCQTRLRRSSRYLDSGNEILPKYECSVTREGPMYMLLESCHPFLGLPAQEWRDVYVILQGTQLSIYKLKNSHMGREIFPCAGKMIRKYTLQQAEVGLAPDATHHVLVPVSRLAHLIPAMARRRAYEKDPEMFRVEKRHSLRLRLETDQLVLAQRSEDVIMSWVNKICAGIDIAPAIDERSVPRQCTVPRRRRRQRVQVTTNLADATFIEEQERILREMYPAFAERTPENQNTQVRSGDSASQVETPALARTNTNDQEQEDVDLSALAEEQDSPQPSSNSSPNLRPHASRRTTAGTVSSAMSAHDSMLPDPLNFTASGKWRPIHARTMAQQLRYVRRCMPLLYVDSPRASGVMIYEGRFVRANYKMEVLDDWSLQPPSYDAHDFHGDEQEAEEEEQEAETMPALTRSVTSSSSVSGATSPAGSSPVIRSDSPRALDIETMARQPLLALEKLRSGRPGAEGIKVDSRTSTPEMQRKAERGDGIEPAVIVFGF